MQAPVTIVSNATKAQLVNPTRQVLLAVQEILSYEVSPDEKPSFKTTSWTGRSSFLEFTSGRFPAGFVDLVTAHLKRRGFQVMTRKAPLPVPLGPENPKVDNFPEDPRYDYQPEVMRRLVQHGRFIAKVATGGGKSRICRLCIARIARPTLFITTRAVLMYQMADALRDSSLGAPGIIGDDVWQPKADGVTCAMVQTLVARLEDKTLESELARYMALRQERESKELHAYNAQLIKDKSIGLTQKGVLYRKRLAELEKARISDEDMVAQVKRKVAEHQEKRSETIALLKNFEFVIGEEAHESSSNSYYDVLRHCVNALYRLALTATPMMKEDEEANMRLMAAFGAIGIDIPEKMLIDRGILAKPIFKYVEFPAEARPAYLMRGTSWQSAYRLGITDFEWRNEWLVWEAKRFAAHRLNGIVLVLQRVHGKTLEELMRAAGLRAVFVWGESDQAERKAALKGLEKGELDVVIGSNIFDVGVDVPSVNYVMLAGGGKAEVALRQRIGRGAREKKKGFNQFFIVDFTDPFNNHTRDHYKQRRAIVESTPGFVEGVLGEGEDFDFTRDYRKEAPLIQAAA